jgi:formylglycine-generating enzyme required for sulfatase activity
VLGIKLSYGAIGTLALATIWGLGAQEPPGKSFENALGVRMIRIAAGTLRMGNVLATDHRALGQHVLLTHGDYDETPVHDVRLSRDFYMSETEITVPQFQQFRQEYQNASRFSPAVTGVSYDEAVAFCRWLARREGKPYRLPTEAEWEYVARAGSASHFSSGAQPPADDHVNAFGVRNIHSGALEWVSDWYGPYRPEPQVDPVGPDSGWGRVVRGGGPQGARGDRPSGLAPFYRRSANRASAPPTYSGMHPIGFRVVMGEAPATPPHPADVSFSLQFVKPVPAQISAGPPADRPWFQRRILLPVPPENMMPDAVAASGLDPGLGGHNHSAGATVTPNGDLLVVAFTSTTQQAEYQPGNNFAITRRRFGSEEWDVPSVFMDLADVQDASALLWTDRDTVHFFGGGVGLTGVPFRWTSSTDSGATWLPLRLPLFERPLGGYSPQPISTAFRTADGTMHMAIDGNGGQSLLLASRNNGLTWYDVGEGSGTRGRHTVYAVLDDGSLFALGGKETNIDGFMPQFRSTDGGRTWTESRSPFPALASQQRPTLVRLKSGRLFFASDWQDRTGKQPAGVTERGAFVALSGDGGRTWRVKTLPNARKHEAAVFPKRDRRDWAAFYHDSATLGYAVATQAPNGLIHLITSMTHPSDEFEMNEAWILSDTRETSMPPAALRTSTIPGEARHAAGRVKANWVGRETSDGRYLLDGPETWFYPGGAKQYSVTYRAGRKVGKETYWAADGKIVWEWERSPDGRAVWTQYWSNGRRKHRSEWRDAVCDGPVMAWTPDGKVAGEWRFVEGDLARR